MQDIQTLTIEQVYLRLKTRSGGLTPDEVRTRHTAEKEKGDRLGKAKIWAHKITRQFTHFFALLLLAAAALCFFVERFQPGEGMLTLGWAIILVVFINGTFCFIQEYRAGKAAQALKNMLPQKVKVRRAAGELVIPVEEVTEGDIVILEEGDKVPADIRLVEVNGLQVNNATITGESDVLECSAGPSGADSISGLLRKRGKK